MTRKPIVIVTESLRRSQGGEEIYMANFSEFLAREGHPVHVLVRRESPDKAPDGVKVEVVDGSNELALEIRRRTAGNGTVILSTIPLPGAITHYQPHAGLFRDAFEASGESHENTFHRYMHALGNRLNLKRQRLMKMQEALLTSDSRTRTMIFSHRLRSHILDRYEVPPANLVTTPLGVDLAKYRPDLAPSTAIQRSSPDNLALLFVGHNFRLKGLHCLLSAFHDGIKRGLKAELWVAGTLRRTACHDLVEKLGLGAHVKFLGGLRDSELARLYCASDVLVHPTFSDHCSLVVLEALACGRPVITTRLNGAAELFENGKEGIILDHPRDLEGLTEALMQMQDRERLAEMSRAAVALRPRLDFEKHARATLQWLTAEGDATH